ncbi:MAG: 4a-hydroxytetrahydrobiopterin dehydratase [Rhodocyclaceae bacterium]
MTRDELASRHCAPHSGAVDRLTEAETAALIRALPGWSIEDGALVRTWSFADYGETMAFANGVAWLAQREDHHPELAVGYNRCRVAWSTHDVGGLSMNDFVCAAKLEALRAL